MCRARGWTGSSSSSGNRAIYEIGVGLLGESASLFAVGGFDRALIEAVVEGRQSGRLFVDDPHRPGAALLCRTYDWYIAGDHAAGGLRRFIADAPAEAGVFQSLYGLVPIQPGWIDALVADSGGRLEIIPRRAFTLRNASGAWRGWERVAPPSDAVLAPIDADLAERIDRELDEHIGLLWGGYEQFARHGFGYCAVVDGRPASAAYAVAVSARHANVSIGTRKPLRRRGLARLVCSAFLAHCLARDLVCEWDSDASNLASAALAHRLGFHEGPGFTELALPGRTKPAMSRGIWAPQAGPADGSAVIPWRRGEG
jgi:RimJ/RimL family protein N-acetyltransferase